MAASAGEQLDEPATRRAVEFLLHVAGRRLEMDAAFFAEVTVREQVHLATAGDSADSFTIRQGERIPREQGYCHHVLTADTPWVIRDTSTEPLVRDLEVTTNGRLAAYLGVPVHAPDGEAYGTLCCMHHGPREDLDDRDVAVMEALAEVLGLHIAQLQEGGTNLGRLAARVAQLTDEIEDRDLELDVYRRMVHAAPSVTLLLDAQTLEVDYANLTAAELVGWEPGALVGRHPWELNACWEESSLRQWLAPLQSPDAWPVSYTTRSIDSAPAMDVQAQRIVHPEGGASILWEGHDVQTHQVVTERLRTVLEIERHAVAELKELDRQRHAFLSAVSHELRTPLTAVKGLAELLEHGHHRPDDEHRLVQRLTANTDRLDRLLTDLLDLNRFAHGVLEIEREPVELDVLVRDVVDDLDIADHPVELDLAPISLAVAPVKVERIVANLVLNAAVHTPAGHAISVTVAPRGNGAQLTVADQGEGIPTHDRERIFEPFQQGASVPSHRPGTGIGLSLVAAFAQLHGGQAWVDDADGGGAAFHVLLPGRAGN